MEKGTFMYIEVFGLSPRGPWACNLMAIEKVIDLHGSYLFGLWLLEEKVGEKFVPVLIVGFEQVEWRSQSGLPPKLILSYDAMHEMATQEFEEYGYEELYLIFSFPLDDSSNLPDCKATLITEEGLDELEEHFVVDPCQIETTRIYF